MPKSAMIRARINPELKTEVEGIFDQLGLSTTEAITLFYRQVHLNQGLPFAVRLPNKTTRQTFERTDRGQGITQAKDEDDLFEQLGL